MKAQYSVPLSMLAGIGVGAVAVQTLHAQAKPPVYYVAEIDVTNPDAYAKEYAPEKLSHDQGSRRSLPSHRRSRSNRRKGDRV